MKITNVRAIVLKLPEISTAADGTQDDLLIIVDTDEGITGYGEVDTAPIVGKAVVEAYMSHGTCYGLKEVVVGADPSAHALFDTLHLAPDSFLATGKEIGFHTLV